MSSPFIKSARDAELIETKALPAEASTSVVTDAIDIGSNGLPVEVVVEVPALSVVILPDASTSTATVEVSNDAAFADYDTIATGVQTGAGGAGAAALSVRAAVPPVYRYVRAKVAFGASTTTGAAVSATLAVLA